MAVVKLTVSDTGKARMVAIARSKEMPLSVWMRRTLLDAVESNEPGSGLDKFGRNDEQREA